MFCLFRYSGRTGADTWRTFPTNSGRVFTAWLVIGQQYHRPGRSTLCVSIHSHVCQIDRYILMYYCTVLFCAQFLGSHHMARHCVVVLSADSAADNDGCVARVPTHDRHYRPTPAKSMACRECRPTMTGRGVGADTQPTLSADTS